MSFGSSARYEGPIHISLYNSVAKSKLSVHTSMNVEFVEGILQFASKENMH